MQWCACNAGDIVTLKRMDNVGIAVENIDTAIEFFTELGLELEGRAPIEGSWEDGVTGFSTRTPAGSATSAVQKEFSSGSHRRSGSRMLNRVRSHPTSSAPICKS